jgi:tetratricopeptide (TPR) repeat protein
LVVLLPLAAYLNSFGVPFVFDDLPAIVENPSIRRLSAVGEVLLPNQAGGVTTSGRPLVNLSFALNHAVSGYAVWSYHAANVVLHLAAALTFFCLVRRTCLLPTLRDRFGASAPSLATAAALLWAVHPLQTAAVTYVVQRAEALAAFFYLTTLYGFVRAVHPPSEAAALASDMPHRKARSRWLATSVAMCAAGMASKEVMVSAPVIVLLFDRTFVSGSFKAAWRARSSYYVALGSTWLLLAGLVLSTGGRGGTAGFGTEMSSWNYLLTQSGAIVRYVGLSVWPQALVFDYGIGTVRHAAAVLPQLLVVTALLGATVYALVRKPALGFFGACFFAVLAPSSSIVPVITQTVAEHRMYLPLAVLAIGFAVWITRALGRHATIAVGCLSVAFAVTTAARNRDYRSEIALWADTAEKYPVNARAHNNLGQALFRAGDIDAAVTRYRRALALQPRYPETHYNLGVALARQGHFASAIEHYETALRIEPDYPEALNNLGNALVQSGRVDEALHRYAEALRRRPNFAEAHNNWGNALLQSDRLAEARERFERALQLRPDYAEAHYNLGNTLAAAGDMVGALARYQAALTADARYAAAHVNAGNALLELKRPVEALAHYEAALAVDPSLADAHFNRGSVLLELERSAEAIPALQAVLRLRADHPEAHRALGFALAQTGRAQEALPHYERYLVLRPNDETARDELRQLRRLAAPSR